MASLPHYFIAIPLPEELQNYFSLWRNELHDKLPYKQWYHKQDLHITLKFLGAVNQEKIEALYHALKKVEGERAFELEVGSIGIFGNPKRPRVLWAGVENANALLSIQKKIEDVCLEVSFSKENRPYRPHITLAKKWTGNPKESYDNVLEQIQRQFTQIERMHVHEIVVFQIHPGRQQKYEPTKRYRLS
ncbi:RNA 2',3'-cyclic phosphodiesterase [Oceanobacillus senegalensis]|uniref:RNA 2',3'-cyclic phosphodiesterase n=1 Tax=Oceanobacillus senegalensis TaxID=1936063 RepID=UPI000A3060B4|nr:RNA 2',3'-cyclic phosphodiesterase [Oceanobacillus senegalensis]